MNNLFLLLLHSGPLMTRCHRATRWCQHWTVEEAVVSSVSPHQAKVSGFEPTTFVLRGHSAHHCTTADKNINYYVRCFYLVSCTCWAAAHSGFFCSMSSWSARESPGSEVQSSINTSGKTDNPAFWRTTLFPTHSFPQFHFHKWSLYLRAG